MFKNVRLVCRLRKSSPSRTSGKPSNASSAEAPAEEAQTSDLPATPASVAEQTPQTQAQSAPTEPQSGEDSPFIGSARAPRPYRYFILKSLTKEDVAWSVANKIWATQPHNEKILREAFKVREFL